MQKFTSFILFLSIFSSLLSPISAHAQENTPPTKVVELIENMTPAERVGQLFLISLAETELTEESDLATFLSKYPIGGIILRTNSENFTLTPDTNANLYHLNSTLQKTVWNASQENATEKHRPTYIPLLIGISQEDSQSLSGLSPQPSQMAIGATWNTDLATQNGEILGRELAALGFNLYLGPSLDVIQDPSADKSGDLGTSSFGENTAWVGEMGKAYISGLHSGSEGKMLVIAQHFPGRGSADRTVDEEIATAHKTLDELIEIDLAPFAEISGFLPAPEYADGLLVSHIRYQGFQGNIRPTTRPISLDEQALTQILALTPFNDWRNTGGITISEDLSSRAIREFYAPGGEDFYAHLVARDAFLAGNDLLFMGNITSSDAANTYAALAKSLDFFTQKYTEDSAFAARVDEALIRILTQKFRIYPAFTLATARPSTLGLEGIGENQEAALAVAQNSATLISPKIQDLNTLLPFPPALEDQLIFISDSQDIAITEAVLQLYGEESGEIISANNLYQHSFAEYSSEGDTFFANNLHQADWVILSLSDLGNLPTLRQLLAENQNILREKKVILFSFVAPYALDTTDTSKLTAYYALYSSASPFIETAARLLFQELTPVGAAPVSISGIGYDLSTVTQPAPEQLLTLNLALPNDTPPTPQADGDTPAPTAIPMFQVGDTLAVRTGAIVDHNGNLVPDGTIVIFSLTLGNESGTPQLIESKTSGGTARADFQLDQTGLLDIRVSSGEAIVSEILRLDISDEGVAVAVTIIPPALEMPATPTPTLFPTPTPEISLYFDEDKPRKNTWLISFFLWVLGAILAYFIGKNSESVRWGIRWALATALGGIAAYNYLALGLPAAEGIIESGISTFMFFIFAGELAGWAIAWIWSRK